MMFDAVNLPPPHGGPLGDVWYRGLAKPDHYLTALKEDFYILVAGCMMKYIRLEKIDNGLSYKSRIVKQFNHGVDGISAIAGSQFRDVYAMAERKRNARIFLFQITKSDRGELEPQYMHSLKRVHSWDIRSLEFISKDLLVVHTGIPTFTTILFRWNSNEEVMTSQSIEPNLFSKLLVSPVNPCHWIEYGNEHMYVYEMASLVRNDVIRTKINLPSRNIKLDHADPLMGRTTSTKILSCCWTIQDEFYMLDEQLGIHSYLQKSQVLHWVCSLAQTFLGMDVEQIVSYGEGIAAITTDGWFLSYSQMKPGGVLEVLTAYKLSSKVLRYIQFPENAETFFAVTESKGMIEGVSHGMLRDPFAIPDLMFTNIICCCFIEPQSDYMAIVTKFGKVVILECETGAPIAKWRLPFKVVGLICHPILPFLFCGTTYGCINVLDIRNLKLPKLINRRFFTREPNSSIEKFGFVSQGRYLVSADTTNNRIFVQYGYPFMAFDYIDTCKVPANISQIMVPGCGKDDHRFQVYMSGKTASDQGVVAFIINFSLKSDRLMVLASQIVDQPVTAMCLSPMTKYQYAYFPVKKTLGVVQFCDDNQWVQLQDPEYIVDSSIYLKYDVTFMVFNATKLYTFQEDGTVQVHEAPVAPLKKPAVPTKLVLQRLEKTQTHCYSTRGIKEGVVSLDGSQVIALGVDGTFTRVRFFPKPSEPDWKALGYESRPKLAEYQIGTYLIDQEFQKAGEEFSDRIAEIKVKLDMDDPVNFAHATEETSDEEEEVPAETPKGENNGEKFKYGPRKSFKGNKTRRKKKGNKESKETVTESGGEATKQSPAQDSVVTEETTAEVAPTELPTDATQADELSTSKESQPQTESLSTDGSPPQGDTPPKAESPEAGTAPATAAAPPEAQVVMVPDNVAKTDPPIVAAAVPGNEPKDQEKEKIASADSPKKPIVEVAESSAVQKLMSKMQQAAPAAPTPLMDEEEAKAKSSKKLMKKLTTTAIKNTAPSALKGLLSERLRRKEMVKEKEKIAKIKIEAEKERAARKSGGKTLEKTDEAGGPSFVVEDEDVDDDEQAEEEEEATGESGEGSDEKREGTKPAKSKKIHEASKAAKVLAMLFGNKKKKDGEGESKMAKMVKKIKKFHGGQASKMLAKARKAEKGKAGERGKSMSRAGRTKGGHAKMMKFILEEEKSEAAQKKKKEAVQAKKRASRRQKSQLEGRPSVSPRRKTVDQSEATKQLIQELEAGKLHPTVLMDPAIALVPEKATKSYEGLDVSEVMTVDHGVRRKEFTEAEFFAQFEKTLLYRQHVPKAQGLREEFSHFTELMEELMFFNKQREEGNQVEMKEFNFDEDREPRLKEKTEKLKKIANIQMTVRNKLRHAKIQAMQHLVWDQFETKGMTVTGFRKKMEVSNYPLIKEEIYLAGPVKEAISWRRLEMRLELEEQDALLSANGHALRVLQHEMQYMTPAKKRVYMKAIMAIDPSIRFEDYEASDDSDQSDEFFKNVFEELGLQLPEDGGTMDIRGPVPKAGQVAGLVIQTNRAAQKWLSKLKKNKKAPEEEEVEEESYVEKLKRMLLEEQEREDEAARFKPMELEPSVEPSEDLVGQSRRDFMVNFKPTKLYQHSTGLFGPAKEEPHRKKQEYSREVEVLMKAQDRDKSISVAPSVPDAQAGLGGYPSAGQHGGVTPSKMRMVIRQRKKLKFKRKADVVIEDEEDRSEAEEQAVIECHNKKFNMLDEAYKERFNMISNIFYGSSVLELMDLYQYQPSLFRYSQFDLASRHELWRHHYIVMYEIYQLKKFFNRQFEMLKNSKAFSMKKMADKNDRIREIYYYLKVDLDILDEKYSILEDPAQIFTVTKDEIPIERYLTAEQRRLEELRRLEDLARRRTRMAEFRKKALIIMMDNRLDVKREEILINDIPKPPFMLEKDPLEYTLEEYLLSLQYAEAVEALEKARIEMVKELEEELGRLYKSNALEINTLDLRITELGIMKFQFYQNTQMEECRILRAIRQLRTMEELDKEELRIGKIVGDLKNSMKSSQHMAAHLETKKTACEEEIAKVADKEKEFEKNFRKDLGDVGKHFEAFFKLYKKRPKISMKGLNKPEVYDTMLRALKSDNIRVFARENGEIGRVVVMSIYDLEDPLQMPKDCPRSHWDKFNKIRRERLLCHYQTKTMMTDIDRINEAISECSKKEAEGTAAIASVLAVIAHKYDLKNYFVSNVEFQIVLGKGQVEINVWNFRDHQYSTVILIENVESLNTKIFTASEKLIREMTKTASVHRDIKEIEWRFLVVEMATKDLKKLRHDVQCFKPTRKLLELLRKGINLDTMHTDRLKLVDYLRQVYIKYQKLFLKTKKKQLVGYKHQTKHKHETNEKFKGHIFKETEELVAAQVNRITPEMTGRRKEDVERRAAQLLFRGYLNRKIIRLSNEIEKLEEELEKQYHRTYPILQTTDYPGC